MSLLTHFLELIKPSYDSNINIDDFATNFDKIDSAIEDVKKDYVIEYGQVGLWYYRKWSSGVAECWIEQYTVSDININGSWDSNPNMHYAYVKSPGSYPITFVKPPMVIPTWGSNSHYSSPLWATPNGTTTECPRFQMMDPVSGCTGKAIFGVYVKGRWKA